jgi:hypothetical protein
MNDVGAHRKVGAWVAGGLVIQLAWLVGCVSITNKDPAIRRQAVYKLSDQAVIASVAQHDGDADVRRAALGKLRDQAAIAGVAKHDADANIRTAAVGMLTDHAALAEIAQNASDENVALAATRRIADYTVLLKLAAESAHPAVRKAAFGKVGGQSALGTLATNAKYPDIRSMAVRKVNETSILQKIVAEETDADTRSIAERKLRFQKMIKEPAADNVLVAKYGQMKAPESRPFSSSVAWWDAGNTVLVLLFRNYDLPSEVNASPPEGGAKLFIMVRKSTGMGFDTITEGIYKPIVLERSVLQPVGALALFNKKQQHRDFLGAYWEVTRDRETRTELWGDVDNADTFFAEWKERGTVTLTKVSLEIGGTITGELALGDAERGNCAFGNFNIGVVKAPPRQ